MKAMAMEAKEKHMRNARRALKAALTAIRPVLDDCVDGHVIDALDATRAVAEAALCRLEVWIADREWNAKHG